MKYTLPFLILNLLLLNYSSAQNASEIEKDSLLYIFQNNDELLPLDQLNRKVIRTSYGKNTNAFGEMLNKFSKVSTISKDSVLFLKNLEHNDVHIISYMATENDSIAAIQLDQFFQRLKKIPNEKIIVIVFGLKEQYNARHILNLPLSNCNSIIYCNDTSIYAQQEAAQLIMGARKNSPPNTISAGIKWILGSKKIEQKEIETNGRLRYTNPDFIGLNPEDFKGIDSIAHHAIEEGAFPGCQVLVSIKGNIVYEKSFGHHTYESDALKVKNNDVYDIASITKIAGSTLIAMYLEHFNLFHVDKTLGKYIPELTQGTEYENIVLREMMAHQAGLKSWIPFYIKTLKEGILNPEVYRDTIDSLYAIPVAENIFIHKNYTQYMYDKILSNPLGAKKYKYSDLCYYFTQKVFESILGEGQDVFLHRKIYEPMGLQNIRYTPLNHFEKDRIIPTEHDQKFRKQLIHGYVHDPGAAMLGGVGGHAGIFSNAADLASIMQLFIKNGSYAGNQFFTESIRTRFTKKQYENNRRGIGFDRPRENGGGTCSKLASQSSFGHSGFTGALAWADPKDEVIFIFLSNRVHPNQENWKIRDMNIRTDMQKIVYQALRR
ncbi:MAG: serine hydrolase [Crocinitomicaceae bacterium]|nr:serine hydrolase [Crocinitomicaceae bacterium]